MLALSTLAWGCSSQYEVYLTDAYLPAVESVSGGEHFETATFVMIAPTSLQHSPDSLRIEVFAPPFCNAGGRPERFDWGGNVGWSASVEYELDERGSATLPYPDTSDRAVLHLKPYFRYGDSSPIRYEVAGVTSAEGGVETILVFLNTHRSADCTVI